MKYTLIFSASHVNALVTEMFLSSYGELPCVFVVENNMWNFYLPDDFLPKLGEEGYARFTDPAFLPDYRQKATTITDRFKKLFAKKERILVSDKNELLEIFNEFVQVGSDFFKIYRITEFFYFSKTEAELFKWAKAAYPEKHNEIVASLLSGAKMDATENIKQIVHVIREIQELRLQLREILNKSYFGDSIFMALMKKFEEFTGRKDFPLLRVSEVQDVLLGKEVPPANDRMELLVVYEKGEQWHYLTGAEAQKIAEKIKPVKAQGSELRGVVASPGKAEGIVRIYAFGIAHTFENMKKGDVLVASTTGPEFMVAIQKAGAIVTDEGGLMSHAAVVSRELKIPCIVGTKTATETFKDGDVVEVDAEKGVVRIIKRAK